MCVDGHRLLLRPVTLGVYTSACTVKCPLHAAPDQPANNLWSRYGETYYKREALLRHLTSSEGLRKLPCSLRPKSLSCLLRLGQTSVKGWADQVSFTRIECQCEASSLAAALY